MTKITKRDLRHQRRHARALRLKVADCERDRVEMKKKLSAMNYKHLKQLNQLKSRNKVLEKNISELRQTCLKQQEMIRQQHQPATLPTAANLDCAKAMLALSLQVCRTCLGTKTMLKTKKNIRYSVECKSCKHL